MSDLQNSWTRLYPGLDAVFGRIVQSGTGTTVALGSLSGDTIVDQPNVSLVQNSAGNYTVTVQNFLGPNGVCLGAAWISTTGTGTFTVYAGPGTYSGNAASLTFYTFNASAVATDCTMNFQLLAY